MDAVIGLMTTLFLLSMISERIADFIKLYYSDRRLMGIHTGNLKNKSDNREEEAQRTRRMIFINITIGTIVAMMLRADMISILKHVDKPAEGMGWDKFREQLDWNLITFLPGCFLTGCFLSLGSKFWHDLVDLLLQVKNIKKNINDRAQMDNEALAKVQAVLTADEEAAALEAVRIFKIKMMTLPEVTSVVWNRQVTPSAVYVYVTDKFLSEQLVPTKIFYQVTGKLPGEIPVLIQKNFQPVTHGALHPGDVIQNQNPYPKNFGSNGGIVLDGQTGEQYFLTCYHVVKSPLHQWDFAPVGSEQVTIKNGQEICGSIIKAFRTEKIDVAIMRPSADCVLSAGISGIGVPLFTRRLNENDERFSTQVKMFGAVSKFSVGNIVDIEVPARLRYYRDGTIDTELHQLNDLVFVRGASGTRFSQPGDSGSFVIDEYNFLIGILVGGNGDVSFVIPIQNVFSKLNLMI